MAGTYNPSAGAVPSVNPPPSGQYSDEQRQQLRETLNPIKLTIGEIADWRSWIKQSEERTTRNSEEWEILLKEYLPMVSASGKPEDLKVNSHFRNVHTKMGQLFVRSPEVRLTPEGPMLDQIMIMDPNTGLPRPATAEDAISTKQAVINKFMGPDFIDGIRLMDECIFDITAWSGLAAVKVGYKAVSRSIQRPMQQIDPMTGQPMLVLDPTGQPITETVQVPIHKEYYATRFSPKKLLLDEQLKSCRHEKQSRWIGHRFFIPRYQAIRDFGLSDHDLTAASEDDKVYKHEDAGSESFKGMIGGVEIFYKACQYVYNNPGAPNADHPEAICQLILLDSMNDSTAVSRPSPDQTFDESGILTQDSLIGFPIKIGCIRDLADSPFPKADSAFTNSQVKHLNTHRRQSVKIRDVAIGKYLYDTGAIDDDDLARIQSGTVGDYIGVKAGLLAGGADKIITTTQQVKASPDDWRTAQTLKSDMDETLGIGNVQAGVENETVRSATEIAATSNASAGRMEKEQTRMVAFYLSIVRPIDTLIVRYMQGEDYVSIAGEDGARRLQMWNSKMINIRVAYSIKPDSQLRVDTARDRQQKMAGYNLLAKDPIVNRIPIVRDLARDFGWDVSQVVLSPEQIMAQPPHGGEVNKHQMENSGGRPNEQGASRSGDNRQERNPAAGAGPARPQ